MEAFPRLPYEVLIPNTLFENELLKFTPTEKKALIRDGLQVVDLPGERVTRARQIIRTSPRLSVNDAFAFSLAESHPGCILLTGDGALRLIAEKHQIEVHGVLWVVDELHYHDIEAPRALHHALTTLRDDPAVRLPRPELLAALRRYARQG